MARPVHYAAHGTSGMAFDCYHRELTAWSVARKAAIAAHPTTARTNEESRARSHAERMAAREAPMPLGHTDLSKVTCAECWRAVRYMADMRLNAGRG